MTRCEVGRALDCRNVGKPARSARHRVHQKGLVIPDTPAVDDHAFEPRRASGQHGRSRHAGMPQAVAEFVPGIAGLFGEQRNHIRLAGIDVYPMR